jgi:hypothetical protein
MFVEIRRFCGICPKTFETDCRFSKGSMVDSCQGPIVKVSTGVVVVINVYTFFTQ